MKIFDPEALNEIGGRKNNEDSIYPAKGNASRFDRLFLVCDGVGGQEKGEVASALVCKHFPLYFSKNSEKPGQNDFLEKGLQYVENAITEFLEKNPESRGMASTLTLLRINQDGTVQLGWVGDSRIYHIRQGKIRYKTKDHSEVQSLIDMGEITEEEAESHPRRHVITRAVSGESPARMDTHTIQDIRKNDYFLLCTDGVLETLKEADFKDIFKAHSQPAEIKRCIYDRAEGNTRDNFSLYLVKIQEAERRNTLFPPKTLRVVKETVRDVFATRRFSTKNDPK